eukprot:CAMPEP_0206497580 /NCGR_PEP_ID=MMETSP0324_2-20121206/50318_1 /ASSEMBLY_ACC=CAM_ASM_000836 /TAXON_ID=2866 /ORGANISM="Crypthecodinium cohnii, Strain Seligo" /LENGTH=310 /DNA_ID=CAMNT_0053983273 /DNA_START=122 /DNA_END=1051 /DNA_ORIENTATION=+
MGIGTRPLLLVVALLASSTPTPSHGLKSASTASSRLQASTRYSLSDIPELPEKPDWLGEATSWKDTKLEVKKHYEELYNTCKELREVNAKTPEEKGGTTEKPASLFEVLDALRAQDNDDDDEEQKKKKEEEEAEKKKKEEEAEEESKKQDEKTQEAGGEDAAAAKEKEEKEAAEKAEKEKKEQEDKEAAEKAEKEKKEQEDKEAAEKAEKENAERAEALNKLKEEKVEKYKACVDSVHSWAGVTKGIQELSLEGNKNWKKEREDLLAKLKPLEHLASPEGIEGLLASFYQKIIPDIQKESDKIKAIPSLV